MAEQGDPTESDRLKALDERIARLKGEEDDAPMEEHYTQAQVAWRMVTELVAGLGIGFGIGYGLDAVFGTKPWLMVLFIFLGFAAGVQTMLRTAQEVQNQAVTPPENEDGSGPNGKRSD